MMSMESINELVARLHVLLQTVEKVSPYSYPPQDLCVCVGKPELAQIQCVRNIVGPEVFVLYLVHNEENKQLPDLYAFLQENERTVFVQISQKDEFLIKLSTVVKLLKSLDVNVLGYDGPSELKQYLTPAWDCINTTIANNKLTKYSNLHRIRCGIYNLPSILKEVMYDAPDVSADTPFIVCGAGPSLKTQLSLLKKYQDVAYIIAVGHAVSTLTSGGIAPDFVIDTDPNCHLNWTDVNVPDSVLVASTCISPEVAHRFKNVIWCQSDIPELNNAMKLFKRTFRKLFYAKTVTVSAIDFALSCGSRTIALVGNDLAIGEAGDLHSDGKRHVSDEKIIEKMGLDGKKIRTTIEFTALESCIEEFLSQHINHYQPVPVVYNCTAQGVIIKHTERLQLESFLRKFSRIKKQPVAEVSYALDSVQLLKMICENLKRYRDVCFDISQCAGRICRQLKSPQLDIPRIKQNQQKLKKLLNVDAEHADNELIKYFIVNVLNHADDTLNEMPLQFPDAGDAGRQLDILNTRFRLIANLLDDLIYDFTFSLNAVSNGSCFDTYNLNPFVFKSFRQFALQRIAASNRELSQFLANWHHVAEERFSLWFYWKNLPHVTFHNDDGKRYMLNASYVYMATKTVIDIEVFKKSVDFQPQNDAVVFYAPGNWAHVIEFARQYPAVDMLIIDPWPELLNRLINHSMFMQYLSDSVTIVAIHQNLQQWQQRCRSFVESCYEQRKVIKWFENPYTWQIPQISETLPKIKEICL